MVGCEGGHQIIQKERGRESDRKGEEREINKKMNSF